MLKCKRTIGKESGKFVQAKTKALSKCEGLVVAGKLPPATVCLAEAKTAPAVAKATSKLKAAIGKACCGGDKVCANADDILVGEIGIADPSCPNVEGGHAPVSTCADIFIEHPGDLADCIACIDEEHVDEAMSLYYDQLLATNPATQKALNKCQQTIGKETSAYLIAKSKALAKCWDGVLNGKITGPCPDALKAVPAIDKAEDKKVANICKACGGADKACTANTCTAGDVGSPCDTNKQCNVCNQGGIAGQPCAVSSECRVCVGGANAGFECNAGAQCPGGTCPSGVCSGGANAGANCSAASECPGGTCPGNSCGGGTCADDGSDFEAAQIGTVSSCPPIVSGGSASGGVQSLESIVLCVDNVTSKRVDCTDATGVPSLTNPPSDCVKPTTPCTPDGSFTNVQVTFAASGDVGGITVALGYNESKLTIPGSGDDAATRVTNQQSNTTATSNDTDSTLIQAIAGTDPFTPGNLFTVQFDHCTGTVTAADFVLQRPRRVRPERGGVERRDLLGIGALSS